MGSVICGRFMTFLGLLNRTLAIPVFDFSISGGSSRAFSAYREVLRGTHGPLLGFDLGEKHVGLALSDARKKFAFPLSAYTRRSIQDDAKQIKRVCSVDKLGGIVVGLPIVSFKVPVEGPCYSFQRYVGALLNEGPMRSFKIGTVCFWDEAYSSAEAREYLPVYSKENRRPRRSGLKHTVDQRAAAVILQGVLDMLNMTSSQA